jgi:hypothetical protein
MMLTWCLNLLNLPYLGNSYHYNNTDDGISWIYKGVFDLLTHFELSRKNRKPYNVNTFDINNCYIFLESAM